MNHDQDYPSHLTPSEHVWEEYQKMMDFPDVPDPALKAALRSQAERDYRPGQSQPEYNRTPGYAGDLRFTLLTPKEPADVTDQTGIPSRGVGEHSRRIRDQLCSELGTSPALRVLDLDGGEEHPARAPVHGDISSPFVRAEALVQRPEVREPPVLNFQHEIDAQKAALPTTVEARESLPMYDYMFGYFPDAFLEEVRVSWAGNQQHNPGMKMHWARGKSTDHMNKAWRHQWDHARGITRDTDGTWHLAKAIWRLKAALQEAIEQEKNHGNQ